MTRGYGFNKGHQRLVLDSLSQDQHMTQRKRNGSWCCLMFGWVQLLPELFTYLHQKGYAFWYVCLLYMSQKLWHISKLKYKVKSWTVSQKTSDSFFWCRSRFNHRSNILKKFHILGALGLKAISLLKSPVQLCCISLSPHFLSGLICHL